VLQGSIQETFAKEHWEKHGVTVVSYKDQNMAWADLLNGRIDASLVMSAAGQAGFLSKPQGKGFGFIGKPVADDTILGSGIGYGLRKGDEASKKQLDAAIDKVRADGTITRLAAKYFRVSTSASNNPSASAGQTCGGIQSAPMARIFSRFFCRQQLDYQSFLSRVGEIHDASVCRVADQLA
jgi:ABC-type amino acid transport substrate-binding protein